MSKHFLDGHVVLVYVPETAMLAETCHDQLLRMRSVVNDVRRWEIRPGDSMQNAPPNFRIFQRIFFCADGSHDAPLRLVLEKLPKSELRKVVVVCGEDVALAWHVPTCLLQHKALRRSVVQATRRT